MLSQKKTIKCGLCHEHGHNRRTCPSKHVTMRSKKRCEMMTHNKKNQKKEKENICSICLDCVGKCSTTLECGHTFHTKCILTWLNKNNSCPYCRNIVSEMKRENSITLPSPEITSAIYRLCSEAVGSRFTSLTGVDQVRAWYMMFKMEMESLSGDEYEELLRLGE